MKTLILAVLLSPLLQGCGIGMLLAGSGASKAGSAQMMSAYTDYTISMEKVNLEREKAGLKPRPIMTKKEWLKGAEKVEAAPKRDSREDWKEGDIVN